MAAGVVSISARKAHKAHFGAPSSERRKIMSAPLSKELRAEYNTRSLPIRKDDEVKIVRGTYKGREGRIITSQRKHFRLFVEGVSRDKGNGATVRIPVHASNVVLTKLKIDKDRKALLARKSKGPKGEDAEIKALDQYYASSPSPWTRRSSAASSLYSPLLSSSRRISIRTPNLGSPNPSSVAGLLRFRGRWRKAVAALALVLALAGVLYLATDSSSLGEGRSATRFMRAGGFGLDYMGREDGAGGEEGAGATRLPPVEVEGGTSKLCLLFPWRAECDAEAAARRDPFEGLRFRERLGLLFYPAHRGPPRAPLRPGDKPPPAVEVEKQPHAIHHLVRQGRREWKAKLARQSRTLEQAIDEYERRYRRRPPRGFGDWFRFAQENAFVMVDEFDAMMDRVEPFLAVRPSNMVKRHEKLQFDPDFWIQDKAFTVELKQRGGHIAAHGPMKGVNERTEQMLKLLGGIAKHLPDMNVTFTGHDVPWVVLSGEARERHRLAAREGRLLPDEEADDYLDDWQYDGWAQVCPPDSPLRRVPSFDERMKLGRIYEEPKMRSFIKEHVQAMDLCTHPETQLIHGFTAWSGPRPGLLYPLFVSTMTSMHSDLLIPPIDQYDRPLGRDPVWEDKKHNKLVWRGTTTGADLNIEHMRKWSQRPRLCRLPFEAGEATVPFAPSDTPTLLGPVNSLTARKQALAQRWFDFEFLGNAKQCDNDKVCEEFEKDFLWSDWMGPDEQNEYKYMLDVDGNGWSGRFHRLMSTNSLVLKATIFPEWYSEMIQPWVHYVPVQTDYSDLYPIMAFFLGDEEGKGAHDALAQEIAAEGKKWAETHWRWVDMEVYMYRLLLEFNRIMNRDEQNPTSMDL
ncbi:Protein O-glucosyltransferase 2 [Rhodotorula kratochvilovae]